MKKKSYCDKDHKCKLTSNPYGMIDCDFSDIREYGVCSYWVYPRCDNKLAWPIEKIQDEQEN